MESTANRSPLADRAARDTPRCDVRAGGSNIPGSLLDARVGTGHPALQIWRVEQESEGGEKGSRRAVPVR